MRLSLTLGILCLFATAEIQASEEFFISYWWGPEPTEQSLGLAAEANFTVAMAGGGRATLDLARKQGLQVLLQDPRIMAKAPDDAAFEANLDAVLADFAAHPALWGYYVTDEPNAAAFPKLAAICKHLSDRDPKHIPFINLFPTYANQQQLGTPTYQEHVSAFMKTVAPKILSYDHYALMQNGERPGYFENLEVIRRAGLEHRTPFNYILLSVPHFSYRDPTEADLRWQVNTALAYGARGIMYFTYVSPPETESFKGWGEGIVTWEGKPTRKFDEVKRINAELKALGPILMSLTSTAVYHSAPVPGGATPLPEGDLVAKMEGGQLVIGHFKNDSGDRYCMFVNRSPRDPADVKITFSRKIQLSEIDRNSGSSRPTETDQQGSTTVWESHFLPGQGRLIKID